jgi:peptidyl-prolyl cis-trans isomerase SurA
MEELPLGMGVVIEKLEAGEMSKPFRMTNAASNEVVVIARLRSRVNVHQANLQDDYQAIKTMVENKKREEVISNWIVSKQKTTYIRVSDGWRNCDFRHPGWIKE